MEKKPPTPELVMMYAYTDAQDESHCQEVTVQFGEFPVAPPAPPAFLSFIHPAQAKCTLLWAPPGWSDEAARTHRTPSRRIILVLRGEVEVGFSDGTKRRVRAGEVTFFERDPDTSKGHTTRVIAQDPVLLAMIEHPDLQVPSPSPIPVAVPPKPDPSPSA